MQDAGLPILRSLKVLEQQQKGGLLKTILGQVGADVEAGATLSEGMSRHPKAFDRLYVNMVQAGETGGVLDVILQRLAEFMEKAQRLKRREIAAMIYPAVVIGFSMLIVTGIMIFVVPKFRTIFSDFKTDSLGRFADGNFVERVGLDSDWVGLDDWGWVRNSYSRRRSSSVALTS